MKTYTIIRSDKQYKEYCYDIERLTSQYQSSPSEELLDLIDTITLLVEKYDEEHSQLKEIDPIQTVLRKPYHHKLRQFEPKWLA